MSDQRIPRQAGESLVHWYNRDLAARGRKDIEWVTGAGGALRLRDRAKPQPQLDLGSEGEAA